MAVISSIVGYLLCYILFFPPQNIKEKLYFLFEETAKQKKFYNYIHPEHKTQKGIYFLFENEGLLCLQINEIDTLPISELKNYKFFTFKQASNKVIKWELHKYGSRLPFSNKNGVFDTFVIEKINCKQIAIYPVLWTLQGVEKGKK